MRDFEQYLVDNNVGSRGQNVYTGKIRAVYNLIIGEYEHPGHTDAGKFSCVYSDKRRFLFAF